MRLGTNFPKQNIIECIVSILILLLVVIRKQERTDQMAEWYGASASGSVDLSFDSESGRTNDFKIGIHSFPA